MAEAAHILGVTVDNLGRGHAREVHCLGMAAAKAPLLHPRRGTVPLGRGRGQGGIPFGRVHGQGSVPSVRDCNGGVVAAAAETAYFLGMTTAEAVYLPNMDASALDTATQR